MIRYIPWLATLGAAGLITLAALLGTQQPAASAPVPPGTPAWGQDVRVNPTTSLTPDLQTNYSFAVNPTNPDNIVASYDSLDPNNSNSAYSVSTDGGRTWTGGAFYGSWSPTDRLIPFGNTGIGYDRQGVIYYTSQAAGES